jgi:Tfp pilus assembly protein PilP
MGCCKSLSIRGLLVGGCLLAMLPASAPLCGQDNIAAPAAQAPAVATDATLLPDPILSSRPVEGQPGKPSDPFMAREKVKAALLKEDFSYNQNKLVDPFVSFIAPVEAAPPRLPVSEEDFEPPPEPHRTFTPLQKMNLGEIEKGLRAIVWGEFGRRAMVEDGAGKGYIVGVGTPVGERDGVITDIFNDSIVIQQQIWDSKTKRMMPQNSVVKLKKQPLQ